MRLGSGEYLLGRRDGSHNMFKQQGTIEGLRVLSDAYKDIISSNQGSCNVTWDPTYLTAILKISLIKFIFEMYLLQNTKLIFKQCLLTFVGIFQKSTGFTLFFFSIELYEKHHTQLFQHLVHNSDHWLLLNKIYRCTCSLN